jgi:hypothetical protein
VSEASEICSQNFTVPVQVKINYQNMTPIARGAEIGYSFNPDFDDLPVGRLMKTECWKMIMAKLFIEKLSFRIGGLQPPACAGSISVAIKFHAPRHQPRRTGLLGRTDHFPDKNKQMQYFINPVFVAGDKWYVSTSANLIWGDYNYYAGGFNREKYFYNSTVYFRDLVFTASTWFHSGNFAPGAEIDYANFNNEGFGQYSVWVTYYPLSNLNCILPRGHTSKATRKMVSVLTLLVYREGLSWGRFILQGNI